MNQENITVTLTATEHELVNEALLQLQNCFDVVYSYTEAYENVEMRDKMNEINNLRTKFVELWADRFDDETVNQTPQLTPEALEALAEDAEDFLNEMRIELISHSYGHIIAQAQQHGFRV